MHKMMQRARGCLDHYREVVMLIVITGNQHRYEQQLRGNVAPTGLAGGIWLAVRKEQGLCSTHPPCPNGTNDNNSNDDAWCGLARRGLAWRGEMRACALGGAGHSIMPACLPGYLSAWLPVCLPAAQALVQAHMNTGSAAPSH